MDRRNENQKTNRESSEAQANDDLGLKANWNELRGKIKDQYPDLRDDDLDFMSEPDMINRLQRKTGKTKVEVRQWLRSMSKIM